MFLNDGLAFIPSVGKLHFHSFQPVLHEFAICQVSQQLVQVLLHSGLGICSFLTQLVHIFIYERRLFESNNEMVDVCDTITLLYAQVEGESNVQDTCNEVQYHR